ncbi:hypothetical protein OTU49_002954, partial [Cherax quadricarinatus]
MRSMEEEVDVGGPREDFLSEDDHSPTDASEDSVEVRVKPIRAPTHPPTPPTHHKFRKHYTARASPGIASPVEPLVGSAPLSPETRAANRSRRKPAEPRRLCHEPINKRPHSPDPP